MMARRGMIGLLASAVSLVLVGCGMFGGGSSYRFRMTVEVETPRGLRSGSSVMEVTAFETLKLTSEEHGGGGGLRGEAVVVDLPDGPLFVLLKGQTSRKGLNVAATHALAPDAPLYPIASYVETVGKLGGVLNARAELPRDDWPMMVRFRDIGDPRSVEKVDPAVIGVKRIWLETTGDDVTTGIEKRLTWLVRQHGSLTRRMSAPDPANPPLSARLSEMDFSTEINRAK